MKKRILVFLIFLLTLSIYSQDCSSINSTIDVNFSYANTSEDLEMPLNDSWNIALEK